jgi:phenylalanyl-tRNA synthetase alpha chain
MAEPNAEEALRTLERELERGLGLFAAAISLKELEEAETAVLGRKSSFSAVQRTLGGLSEDDRRRVGQRTNEVREALRNAIAVRRDELDREREAELLMADRVDLSLPGRRPRPGSMHPLALVEARIVDVFTHMGYRVVEGPEV